MQPDRGEVVAAEAVRVARECRARVRRERTDAAARGPRRYPVTAQYYYGELVINGVQYEIPRCNLDMLRWQRRLT